ncbi:RNB domain-containing ribonuclease [Cellulomonas aerilata]|uniref:Ribonuclease R n=1 Tax=Cellulomonas aerilata TaxID=515326 RepID=A0A512DAG5_9CELL|nr:RNB domain-containing ribonuclease [Cellulomonas aerilata]GEO33476.1 ribonuclease R [Cellulomonas aerilata]
MIRPRLLVPAEDPSLAGRFAAIRVELDVAEEFPADVEAEAAEAARRGPDDARLGVAGARADLLDVPFVTIDPPGSTDLDQAVHLERRPGGGYRVRYAIADVAAFVRPGGAVDAEARRRGETVYCPDRRIPLHPTVLSEGAASLLPDGVRPAVVWTVDLDASGEVVSADVRRASVRSREQLDYPAVQRALDSAGPADRDSLPVLLAEVGTARSALERARGGVSLPRPEQEVVPDGDGWALEMRVSLPVEDHNAQISLLTGMVAARMMLDAGVGVLRTMPAADAESLEHLRRRALALGVPWPEGTAYGDVLASLDHGRTETAAFLVAATGLFRGAAWTTFHGAPPTVVEHAAIAAPYAHVTAPLRRLVDRFGLEVCLAATAGAAVPGWVLDGLDGLGAQMAAGASRGSAVDRACTDLVEASVLAPHVGRDWEAAALTEKTVQLAQPPVVAGCDGPPLPIGRPVLVRLVEADLDTRSVRFAWDGA